MKIIQILTLRMLLVIGLGLALSCRAEPRMTPATQLAADTPTAPMDAQAMIALLASDEFEGRGLGTAGLDRAADVIANAFHQAGLAPPPGQEGYFQNFQLSMSGRPATTTTTTRRAVNEKSTDRKIDAKNVWAALPGKGPRADEWIVVGAHYDHLGHGGSGSRGRKREIHNGADDNASGTAAMIELARRFARRGPQEQSMLFVAFTGEEAGLLGSAHFVKNSPVPLAKITAMLNLDMVGRVQTQRLYIGGAGTAEPFETILAEADARSPLELATMSKGGLGPSDHMSFAQKKIPVLFFFSGLHRDYHLPSDDADKINHAALEQVIDLTDDVLLKLLTMPRAEYVSRFDGRDMRLGGGSGNRVTLGVIPDYGDDGQMKGVRISGTVANSPAATAGLREGDVIVKFGDYRIDSLYALTDALSSAQAGQVVQLIILRDGQPVELKATLAERR